MIPAEDEEPMHNPAPDSDYYSDLMSRVDNAVNFEDENEDEEEGGFSTERSRVGAFAGWIRGGGHRTHQRLSNQDDDDDNDVETERRKRQQSRPRNFRRQSRKNRRRADSSSEEEEGGNEDDMSAETMTEEQVCLFPSTISEWILQPMVKIVLVALITGLVGGIEAANAMFSVHSVTTHFGLSPLEHSGLVTASIVGGTLGGLIGGTMADLYGRKFVLVVTGMALLPTALTAAAATTIGAVVFARACAAAVAMATASSAIAYVFELAPKRRRGMMPAIWGVAATAAWAFVRVAALHTPSSSMSKHGWRVVGGGPHLFLAFAQLLSLCSLPESPRWLASQNKMHQAHAAIHRIHGTAFSSATAHVIRSELNSLQPSKYVMMLASMDKQGASSNTPNKEEKSTVASRGSYHGDEWEPAWGDASRPCEQFIALIANFYHTLLKTYAALKRWRPVVTLFSSMCTASTAAGGLQVLYWNSKVLDPLLISPVVSEVLLTLSPLTAAFVSIFLLMDDRNGRRPLVITGACLVVGGSLLLSILLVVFSHLPWHGPTIGLRWLLGLPGAIGAIASSSGWQLMVISLLPCLVAEATPSHARCRALAMLTATSVIYAPFTLVGFDTARDNTGAIGPALLMYSCSAGSMLIFLVTVLLVETAGKEPEQILLETINRAGYVLFHMTSLFQGSKCERWAGGLSYAPVGTQCPTDYDDDDEDEDEEQGGGGDDDEIAKAMKPNKANLTKDKIPQKQFKNNNEAQRNSSVKDDKQEVGGGEEKEKECEQDFGTDAKNGRVATAAGAGSLVGMIGGLSYMALKSSIKSRNDAMSPQTGAGDGSSFSSSDTPQSNAIRMKRQYKLNKANNGERESEKDDEKQRMIKDDDEEDDDDDDDDDDEVNLDETDPPSHQLNDKTNQNQSVTDKKTLTKKEPLSNEKNGVGNMKQSEEDVATLIAKLEKDKKEAVASEDYTRAAAITQAIKKLKGEDIEKPTQSKTPPIGASYSSLPPAPKPSSFEMKRQQLQSTPTKASKQTEAKKAQEQRKAAAAMFDSMMDDF